MIRWCLYLRHLSSSAYELISGSGVISLPSQRTLRDYTYYTTAAAGFSGIKSLYLANNYNYFITDDVDEQLMTVAKISTCPEREKCIVLLMDEMHIQANLVYNKHSGEAMSIVIVLDILDVTILVSLMLQCTPYKFDVQNCGGY